jgi:hypothetical protein
MFEFRTYKIDDKNIDYVLYDDEMTDTYLDEGEAEVSSVSLQDGEWYIGYAVWKMDKIPETNEEFCDLCCSDENACTGWSTGSWKELDWIDVEEMTPAHYHLVRYIKEGK